jgi:hypothetical protein
MTSGAALQNRIEQTLVDTGNEIWYASWIEEGLRKALDEYSLARPLHKKGVVSVSGDTYELDISSLTGVIAVQEVWCPYTAAGPEYPPNRKAFRHWVDSKELYFPDNQVNNGDICRVFYTALHTIEGLDSATSTTVGIEDESLLVEGAAGHVAVGRGLDLTEKVSVGQATAQQVRAWGMSTLQQFRTALRGVAQAKSGATPSTSNVRALDAYDKESGWV